MTGLVPGHPAAPWSRCGAGRCLMGIYFLLQSLFSLDFSSLFECLCWSRDRSQQIPCPLQPSDFPGHTVGVHRFIFNGEQTSPVELFPAPAGPAKVCQSEELSSSSARCGMDKPPAPPFWALLEPCSPHGNLKSPPPGMCLYNPRICSVWLSWNQSSQIHTTALKTAGAEGLKGQRGSSGDV